jgi:KDO2-lipid IV(A) lauroyltransferase
MFAFAIYKLGAFLAKSMSLPTARRTANVVGRLMCFLQRRNRRILLRNLETAFGSELSTAELKRLRRKIFQNFAVFVADFLRMPLVTRDNLADYLTPSSLATVERLGRVPASEYPMISITAHLGNWELGTVLGDSHPSPLVTKFFDGRRADKGIEVVPVSSFHRCFRALKGGHLLAIVGDRPVTGQGIQARFFGKEALVPDGYAVLARRFGASVVPTFLVMTPDGRYEFVMEAPIVPRETDDEAGDVRDCVRRTLASFEKYIRLYPEQWYVFRPIWDGPGATAPDRHRRRVMRSKPSTVAKEPYRRHRTRPSTDAKETGRGQQR